MTSKLLCTAMCFIFTLCVYAQIGIGTTSPGAQLDIQSSFDTLPALEINPQTNPVGSVSGQISVIGDQLYLYDGSRSKWLSVESSTLTFGKEGSLNNTNLEYAGDITQSGPKMVRKGTIVYVSMNSAGGDTTKAATIDIIDALDIKTSHTIALSGGSRIYDTYNVDFEQGDHIEVKVSNVGTTVDDLTVVLWVKWRN